MPSLFAFFNELSLIGCIDAVEFDRLPQQKVGSVIAQRAVHDEEGRKSMNCMPEGVNIELLASLPSKYLIDSAMYHVIPNFVHVLKKCECFECLARRSTMPARTQKAGSIQSDVLTPFSRHNRFENLKIIQ